MNTTTVKYNTLKGYRSLSLKKLLLMTSLIISSSNALAAQADVENGHGGNVQRIKGIVSGIQLTAAEQYLYADQLTLEKKMKGSAGWAYAFQGIASLSGTLTALLLGTGDDNKPVKDNPIFGLNRGTVEFTLGTVSASTASISAFFTKKHNGKSDSLATLKERRQQFEVGKEDLVAAQLERALTKVEREVFKTQLQLKLDEHAITQENWWKSSTKTFLWWWADYKRKVDELTS